jgi:hypothetical protein
MVPHLGWVCVPCLLRSFDMRSVTIFNHVRRLQCPSRNRTCRFPTSGSSAELTGGAAAPRRCKGLGGVWCSVQCPTHASASLCVLLPTPSSGPAALVGHYPDYASTMSWSDCHTAIPPPCLFSLLEASRRSGMALPSSDAHRWMTCHGLRPRPGAAHSP